MADEHSGGGDKHLPPNVVRGIFGAAIQPEEAPLEAERDPQKQVSLLVDEALTLVARTKGVVVGDPVWENGQELVKATFPEIALDGIYSKGHIEVIRVLSNTEFTERIGPISSRSYLEAQGEKQDGATRHFRFVPGFIRQVVALHDDTIRDLSPVSHPDLFVEAEKLIEELSRAAPSGTPEPTA